MRHVAFLLPGLIALQVSAQNVAINASGAAPNASALLDLDAAAHPVNDKKGLLVPRLALTATNVAAPVVAPATSLLVYNTATAGVAPNNVTPGFYFWGGASWVRFGQTGDDWALVGNAGTTPVTNFLGTTDNQDLVVRTNNVERFRTMGATGRIGWGTVAPVAPLEVNSGASADAIYGHSNNVGGWLGRETNIAFGNPIQNVQGAGLYANNPTAGYTSAYTQSTGAATVAANINFSDVWIAQYNYVQNNTATFNPPGTYSQLNVTSAVLGGDHVALRSYSGRGTTAGNPGFTIGSAATADAQNQDAIGVDGSAFTNTTTRAGGYFESFNYAGVSQAFAWVGTTAGGIARKITGTAAVSEIIPTADHGRIMLTCPESPEYWYQDYGTVQLVNGQAHVDLDPILADIIMVTSEYPVRVFCTPVDMPAFNGVAQMNRTATGFDLVELNGGTHSGTLDYQIVVKPKTGFGEGRFPQAPGPAWLKKEHEPERARAANQPDPATIFYWPSDQQVYGYDPDKVTPVGRKVPAGGKNAGKFKVAEGVFMDHMPAERPAQ
ncbi:MAG: hypothetical protein IPJ87_10465 [Flavobacteriales bacterium]|nr:hypothetical protein [Flavobacteriales bacterium]MBK7942276.1 hypothetical protein [Flavobacteriales bacterium]MBK9699322.1 hypothetical protein [Flavobacteriales bacterium]